MKLHGINGAELARRLGASPAAVSRWLSGERTPDGQALLAMARVLSTDPWTLLGSSFTEPLPPAPPARRGRPPAGEDVQRALKRRGSGEQPAAVPSEKPAAKRGKSTS